MNTEAKKELRRYEKEMQRCLILAKLYEEEKMPKSAAFYLDRAVYYENLIKEQER